MLSMSRLWAGISGNNCEVNTASAIDLVVTMPVDRPWDKVRRLWSCRPKRLSCQGKMSKTGCPARLYFLDHCVGWIVRNNV